MAVRLPYKLRFPGLEGPCALAWQGSVLLRMLPCDCAWCGVWGGASGCGWWRRLPVLWRPPRPVGLWLHLHPECLKSTVRSAISRRRGLRSLQDDLRYPPACETGLARGCALEAWYKWC